MRPDTIICIGIIAIIFAYLIARFIAAVIGNAERVYQDDWQHFSDGDARLSALLNDRPNFHEKGNNP